MYESIILAERLKMYAKSQKITLKTVFEQAGLGRNTMAHLSDGKSIAHDSLAKIADILNCSVDYLLGRTDDPKCHLKSAAASVDALELEQRIEQKEAPASIAEAK